MNGLNDQITIKPERHVQFTVVPECIPVFFSLLRSGFSANIIVGCSLEHMLCDQLDIEADYLQNRVQTVFLNYSPVDDLATAAVSDGAVISLSAAMPGLNGAIMRRGGPLSGMRRSISYASDGVCDQPHPGRITLKLFNLIARELGRQFLARGVVVSTKPLGELLALQTSNFWQGVKSAAVDRSPCQVDQIVLAEWPEQEVLLQVQTVE